MAVMMIGVAPAAPDGNALHRRSQVEIPGCIGDCRQSEEKSQWVAIRQIDLQCFHSFKKKSVKCKV